MSDPSDNEVPLEVSPSEGKKPKGKKRPSDFEIVRTILQRTHDRKLQYVLKNMGEDPQLLFLCSKNESEFTYGSPDITIGIYLFDDPETAGIVKGVLDKLYGFHDNDHQLIINLRDQISELSKTKGEKIDDPGVGSNEHGSVWSVRKDVNDQERTTYYVKAVDSLFHMRLIKTWSDRYSPLLTSDHPDHLHYPYQHPEGETATIMTLPAPGHNHPLHSLYPHGFRALVTKGLDVILSKGLETPFPYPSVAQEMIVFGDHESAAVQIAHRMIGQGWRMILLRPNAMFFPTFITPLFSTGSHHL